MSKPSGEAYSKRHGGPYDRGSADAWYGRPKRPHYFIGGTYETPEITDLTPAERAAYLAGYREQMGRKDYD